MRIAVLLLLFATTTYGQVDSLDYFQARLAQAKDGYERVDILNRISHIYSQLSLSSTDLYVTEALELAQSINYQKGIASSLNVMGISSSIKGEYTAGLEYFIRALNIREQLKDVAGVAGIYNNISRVYIYQRDYDKALEYAKRSLELLRSTNENTIIASSHVSLGDIYLNKEDLEQAMSMYRAAYELFAQEKQNSRQANVLIKQANVLERLERFDEGLDKCRQASSLMNTLHDTFVQIELNQMIGSLYRMKGNEEKAYLYLIRSIQDAEKSKDSHSLITSYTEMADMFEHFKKYDSALVYTKKYQALNSQVYTTEKSKQLALIERMYQEDRKDQLLEMQNQKIKSQSIIITVITILAVLITMLVVLLYHYYRTKRESHVALEKLNRDIYEKHEEILAQAEELTQANQEIRRINESLEEEVNYRTEKIEQQNKMLIDYAYSNAHNVRGPLARILGLAVLIKEEKDINQIRIYNNHMHSSAEELDHVIRDINNKLQLDSE
jgi:tetratricopeptide (TPR) repeat protein